MGSGQPDQPKPDWVLRFRQNKIIDDIDQVGSCFLFSFFSTGFGSAFNFQASPALLYCDWTAVTGLDCLFQQPSN